MASFKDNYGKYYCKYCDLSILNNPRNVATHLQGNRHKRNVERYMRQAQRGKTPEELATERELRRIQSATGIRVPLPEGPQSRPAPAQKRPPQQHQELHAPPQEDPARLDDDVYCPPLEAGPGSSEAQMPGEWVLVEERPVQREEEPATEGIAAEQIVIKEGAEEEEVVPPPPPVKKSRNYDVDDDVTECRAAAPRHSVLSDDDDDVQPPTSFFRSRPGSGRAALRSRTVNDDQ